jgi:superfamily II DNA or RNA helicase
LKFDCRFAYGEGSQKTAKVKLPDGFQNSDPTKLVAQFEEGQFPILVATTGVCGMGVDFRRVKTIIYLGGGCSQIQVTQAAGRGTRLAPDVEKTEFNFHDFCVTDIPMLERHSKQREKHYNAIYPTVKWVK